MSKVSNQNNKAVLSKSSIGLVALAIALFAGFGVILAQSGDDTKNANDKTSEVSEKDHDDHEGHDHDDDDHSGDETSNADGTEHEDHDDHEGHDHSVTYEYEDHMTLPDVVINSLSKDESGVWSMKVQYANFTITEQAVDSANVPGEGHAHIYVNGEKISRLFDTEFTFGQDLATGDVVTVDLRTNDHQSYTHDGVPIEFSATVK